MCYYLVPLLRKRTNKIILHVGTNDAPHIRADEILEELGKLKNLIWEMLPSVKMILSAPTGRAPTSFCPVTSTNVGIRPQHFLTFSFNPFATLV